MLYEVITLGLRPLAEEPLDGVRIGMRVQEQVVLLRERHHAPRHRQVRVVAVQVDRITSYNVCYTKLLRLA